MLMGEFVAKVLIDFRSLSDNVTKYHPLVAIESNREYDKLERYLLGYLHSKNPIESHLDEIKELLENRFLNKWKTRASYQFTPYSKVNHAYLLLAVHIAEIIHVPVYMLLMPSVKFDASFFQLQPNEFTLIDRGELVPINVVDYLDNLKLPGKYINIGELSQSERRLIIYHSDEARRYANAILLNEDQDVINNRRRELIEAIKDKNYQVDADFLDKGDQGLAYSLLPDTTDWRELIDIISAYIPRNEWRKCIGNIESNNLFKTFFYIPYSQLDVDGDEINNFFCSLFENLDERFSMLKQIYAYIDRLQESVRLLENAIPRLMEMAWNFDWIDMLKEVDFKLPEFKYSLLQKLKEKTNNINGFNVEWNVYANKNNLIDAITNALFIKKKINSFYNMTSSEMFVSIMSFDSEKYNESLTHVSDNKDKNAFLVSHFYEQTILAKQQKPSIPFYSDRSVRVYFLLLNELYRRQRRDKSDQFITTANNKQNKLNACNLFQDYLSTNHAIQDLHVYFLNSNLLKDNDVSSLWVPLTSGVLGRLTQYAIQFENILSLHQSRKNSSSIFGSTEDCLRHLSFSRLARVENWSIIVSRMIDDISEEQKCDFIGQAFSLHFKAQAEKYLLMNALNHANQFSVIIDLLALYLPKHEWLSYLENCEFISWVCAVTEMDLQQIKSISKGDAICFQQKFWESFDVNFKKLLSEKKEFADEDHARAYLFCLAFTYKMQREKRGDYASTAARTASIFSIMTPYSKKDKVKACNLLMQFIISDEYKLTSSDLEFFLQNQCGQKAKKYSAILNADTLKKVTSKVYQLGPGDNIKTVNRKYK